jgi:hypothetical protein
MNSFASQLKLAVVGLVTLAVVLSCLGLATCGLQGRSADTSDRPLELSSLGSRPLAAAPAAPTRALGFAPDGRTGVVLAELAGGAVLGAMGAAYLGSAIGSRFVAPLRI